MLKRQGATTLATIRSIGWLDGLDQRSSCHLADRQLHRLDDSDRIAAGADHEILAEDLERLKTELELGAASSGRPIQSSVGMNEITAEVSTIVEAPARACGRRLRTPRN
jgi:hypothetical protein